jgi:hypothetical protein
MLLLFGHQMPLFLPVYISKFRCVNHKENNGTVQPCHDLDGKHITGYSSRETRLLIQL